MPGWREHKSAPQAPKLPPKQTTRCAHVLETLNHRYVYIIDRVLLPEKVAKYLADHPGLAGAKPKVEACGSVSDVIYYRNDTAITNAAMQFYMPQGAEGLWG